MSSFWDERFSSQVFAYGTEPNEFLAAQTSLLHAGMRALAVADGEGRNGVWLAQHGLDVLSVDFSLAGLEKAKQLARERNVHLETSNVDLLQWDWPCGIFDLVATIFIHFAPGNRERMHQSMHQALKPEGILVLVAFTPRQLQYGTGGPPQLELLYTEEMLRSDFADMEIVESSESVVQLNEGVYHRGPASVVRLVARKKTRAVTSSLPSGGGTIQP